MRESLQSEWNGDEDLGDGTLQRLHTEYTRHHQFITGLGLKEREGILPNDLDILLRNFKADKKFLKEGMEKVRKEKRAKQKSSESVMMTLAWDLHGFEELLSQCVNFTEVVCQLKGTLSLPRSSHGNIKAAVSTLRNKLLNYVKNLCGKKRIAATHLFVFMIAGESCNMKPYAVLVRVLPFKSVIDKKARELEGELRNAMTSMAMPVVGFVTDGEFSSLRTMGNSGPISIIQLISDARAEARSMPSRRMESYLILGRDGNPIAHHPSIPLEDVLWLHDVINSGVFEDAIFEHAIYLLQRWFFCIVMIHIPGCQCLITLTCGSLKVSPWRQWKELLAHYR